MSGALGSHRESQILTRTSSNETVSWAGALPGTAATSTINGLNQVAAHNGTTFTHDANGNFTWDGARTYAYDVENRMVSTVGDLNSTLTYDPMGRLHSVTAGGATTTFLHDGDVMTAEYGTSGALARRYVARPGGRIPLVQYEGATLGDRRFLHADERGSIVATSGSTGAVLAVNRYDEYGIPAATNQGRYGYTGQLWIGEASMWYFRARIYSPYLGRFFQVDPIGYDDQINLYAYVAADPVNSTDPSGMLRCDGDPRCAQVHNAAADARSTAMSASAALRSLANTIESGEPLSADEETLRGAFETRFGSNSATTARLNNAAGFFDRVAESIGEEGSGARVRFRGLKGNEIASATVNGSQITIRPGFFGSDGNLPNRPQAFVILHEAGHLAGLRDRALPDHAPPGIGYFSRGAWRAYGTRASNWLGQNAPKIARRNNDNYMCFADPGCGQ